MPIKNNIVMGSDEFSSPVKVFDSDLVLTDAEEIDYYKACIKELETSNCLIGDINEEGQYVIDEKIRKDLALLPKEITSEKYNLIESVSFVHGKDLYFVLEIEENEEQYIASLYLLEKFQNTYGQDILKTFIAKVIQQKSDTFLTKAKQAFNMQYVKFVVDESKFQNLVLKIENRNDEWTRLEEILDLSSQIYVMRMLQLLEGEGDLGRKIIEEYNRAIKYENGSSARRYVKLRKVLDAAIEKHGGCDNVFTNKKEEVKQVKKEYAAPVRQVEKFRNKQLKEVKKEIPKVAVPSTKGKTAGKKNDNKKDTSKSKSAKPAGGKKPGAKKKPKEKEKKKENKKGLLSGKKFPKNPEKKSSLRPIKKDEPAKKPPKTEKKESNADALLAKIEKIDKSKIVDDQVRSIQKENQMDTPAASTVDIRAEENNVTERDSINIEIQSAIETIL